MKLALTVGAAFVALTLAASAQSNHQYTFIRHHGGGDLNIDADEDGWVTRSEAAAAFDRAFEMMDSNDDGRLTGEDHAALDDFNIRVDVPEIEVLEGANGDRVRVIHRGEIDAHIEREVERAVRQAERAAEQAERLAEDAERRAEEAEDRAERARERADRDAERAAERAEREAERAERDAERAERHADREVIIIHGHGGEWTTHDGVIAPLAPIPPIPPVPPVPRASGFMFLVVNSEEADTNGDGALSREEFRNQHLRFFDASDANGDGRVRFEQPEPPTPPTPPTPPEPPRRR